MNQIVTKISFQHRLNESFQKHQHHIAIESGACHVTYSQLESKANCICNWITSEGIPPESFIGVCFDDTSDIIPVMIGILKARCVFTILDTTLPRQRLLNMIRLTHLNIIFTSAQNKKMLFAEDDNANHTGIEKPASAIVVDEMFYRTLTSRESGVGQYDREDKVYIYFTSGTTGMPRAFVGKNKSLLHFIDWEIETFGIDKTFRFSQWVTPGFDAFLRDVFTPLCAGAVICIPPRKVLEMAGNELINWLNARHIGLIHCVPSIFRLINIFTEKDAAKENFKALKMLVMAGEKIIPLELTRWFRIFEERIQLINLYGTSETTMAKTCYFIAPSDGDRPIVPVGKPIPGARVLILDENLRVCPNKFVGEIYIRTPFRTHGYYNDPQANKDRFIPNPFTHDADDWLHKTGDLGRLLNDDNIEVLGRVDRQVKIRGVRVEPEEIENILLQHPNVAEVAIMDKENSLGETYLCAYFVPRQTHPGAESSETATTEELEEYLTANLPPYMVPAFFIQLEKMPLTSNGKINRRALPEPRLGQSGHYIPPGNEMEEKLAAIWSQVLDVDREKISMDANFFRIGGHSLNATILMSRINRQLGIKIPLAEIFKSSSIRGLASYISTTTLTENRPLSIEPAEAREYYPLSSAQKRLYFLQQLDPRNIAYNMPMVLPLGNSINTATLEAILKKLIARHETLRTSFIKVGDEPFQKIHDQAALEIEYFDFLADDLGGVDNADKQLKIVRDFVRPFDLSLAPLLRTGLIRMVNGDYIWLVDIHHIVTDGTSQIILTEDFFALYQGRELSPLPLQYKDFSQWQNQLLESNAIKAQQEYWLSLLSGEIPRLDLPADYERPSIFTFAGDNYSFILDRDDASRFRELGNKVGATLYMNILTALNVLFHKYTDQTDIIIGSGIAGRLHADLQDIVGMFVNTLPMRNRPSGEKPYEYFLKEVSATSVKNFENQDVQFEDLVEKINPERDPSRNPVFDVAIVVQNFRKVKEKKGGYQGERFIAPSKQITYKRTTSKSDLTFLVNEVENDMLITIEYYTGIFKEETIQRLASHLIAIIKSVKKNPSIFLKDINILSEEEKQQVLQKFNDTDRDYPINKNIHQLFEEQVEKTADHIAVIGPVLLVGPMFFGHGRTRTNTDNMNLTYYQLNEQSNRVAGILIEKGVQADSIVAFMMERSIEMIIGIIGILKAEGAYLPIDPGYPLERIKYMLKDSGASILLTDYKNEIIVNCQLLIINCKLLMSAPQASLHHLSFIIHHSSPLAYIIYTSGTTGKPKGVAVTHRGVVNFIYWRLATYDFSEKDVTLQLFSFTFDGFGVNLYSSLLSGGRLVIVSGSKNLDFDYIANLLNVSGVTNTCLTPGIFGVLLESSRSECLKSLRFVALAGEKSNAALIVKSRKKAPQAKLSNEYGPTETTIGATANLQLNQFNTSIIGKPIANVRIYIIDNYKNLTPIGIAGQLAISGEGLARGYLNNPELTAERFSRTYEFNKSYILYKTGDRACWLPDANIEFLGRIDQQVKIRGFRIELGEIESLLAQYPSIKEAVVLEKTDQNKDKYLCAYIVANRELTISELKEYLLNYLPAYMIPAYFSRVEQIPLTPNGKVDRKALPETEFITEKAYTAPRNEKEEKLVQIWEEVLGLSENVIGIDSNFFDLGGHSLKATTLVAKIHKEFNVKISLAEIFKEPVIRGLSELIKKSMGEKYVAIESSEEKEYYLLSSAQKRLYFLQQMDIESTSYNMPLILPLGKNAEQGRLESTLRKLIARHESLRTSFASINGVPVQRIHAANEIEFKLEFYDLTKKGDAIRDPTFIIQELIIKPFDLSHAPLIRSGLIELSDNNYCLIVDIHHIVSDGTSHTILMEDFVSLYDGNELEPLKLQYKDYSEWQNRLFESGAIKAQENYWLNIYSGEIPRLQIPTDLKRPDVFTFAGAHYGFILERDTANKFKSLTNINRGTLYMSILSVMSILFYKYTGQEDIIIGSGIAGRGCLDIQGIVGMFVNTLALWTSPKEEKTYESFLREVIADSVKAFENQDVQFEELVEKINPQRDLSRNPLFDVAIVVQNFRKVAEDVPGKNVGQAELVPLPDDSLPTINYKPTTSKMDMTFFVQELRNDIQIDIEYYTGIFKSATIKRISEHFENIVGTVIKNPAIKLKDIEIISDSERRQVLFEFNQTNAQYPREKTIHRLFEEQVERTPDHVALFSVKSVLSVGPVNLSYEELNEQSNWLAGLLIEKGVLSDRIVAIIMERSIEMIVAILGIFKAGGAYLPIDPDTPQERIDYMLKDSDVKCLAVANDQEGEKVNVRRWEGEKVYLEKIFNSPKISSYPLTFSPTYLLNSSNLAYVIYTSGTTGKPKGVMVDHSSIFNTIYWRKQEYNLSPGDRALQMFSYAFDGFLTSLFTPVVSGALIVLLSGKETKDIVRIKEIIITKAITHFICVPSLYRGLLDIATGKELSHLKVVTLAGEQVQPGLVEKSKRSCPLLEIVNEYGPTEGSVVTTFYRNVQPGDIISIGKTIANTRIYIMDKDDNLLPPGLAGQLVISGKGLARGYLNNPGLTEDRFNRSYRSHKTYIFYKTGDLARWLPDGNIEFLGRIDQQVKIRGFRIELGEIEIHLVNHPDVKEAVILARVGEAGDKYLCAYFVSDKEILIPELREYLSKALPDYMIPAYFAKIEKMPLTPNGKVDRKALPNPGLNVGESYTAPGNELEKKLVNIWAEILGRDPLQAAQLQTTIGIDDNFFHLGGHSLKATVLTAKIHEELDVPVPLGELFKVPTIRYLGEYINNAHNKSAIDIDRNMVLIKKGLTGDKHLFLVHDGSGEVEAYAKLCKNLTNNFHYWGIRAERLENLAPRNVTIRELAETYIGSMKKIQSHGPFYIAGWSLGGAIAFEMAAQLEQKNDEIAFLALIDSPPPHKNLGEEATEFNLESELNFVKDYIPEFEVKEKFSNVPELSSLWLSILDYLEASNYDVGLIKKELARFGVLVLPNYQQLDLKESIYYLNLGRTFRHARALYEPSVKVQTPVYYISASQSKEIEKELWQKYSNGGIYYYETPGDHFSILQMPGVIDLSLLFSEILRFRQLR